VERRARRDSVRAAALGRLAMTSDQLRRFFEEPGAHLLLDLNFIVLDAGPEYLRTTYTKREDIVGRSVLEIVDDSTHGDYNGSLKASLERVIETREPDKMPIHRYDVLKRTGDGERTEHARRWLKVTNIPIFQDGEMSSIVQRIEDVTLEIDTARQVAGLRRRSNVFYAAVVGLVVAFALGLTIAISHSTDASHNAQTAATAVKDQVARNINTSMRAQAASIQARQAARQAQQALLAIKAQAHASCVIQARGLPAGHELADSMSDIHRLLTLRPTTSAQRQSAADEPAPVRALLADLNQHLTNYQQAEARQPHHRKCGKK
jgi:PAS domain S-box-containing protein